MPSERSSRGSPTSQIARYLTVGATTNLLVLGIYYGATFGTGLPHMGSLFLASAIGFVISYAANRAWSFRFKGKQIGAAARFSAGYCASFAAQGMILYIGADVFRLPHQWVVLFGLASTTLGFFLLQRLWIFPGGGAGDKKRDASA